jgi:hypothetical protein
VLARLWRRTEDPDTVAKPMPLTVAAHCCPQPLPPTIATDLCQKRRRKRVRVCRLYPKPQSQASIHARALLAFIQEECPEYVGGYVPRPDLERFYRRDLCTREGWGPHHWTAIARQLGELTKRKSVRHGGERFVGYRIPKPSTYAVPKRGFQAASADRNSELSDCFESGSAGRIRTYDQPVNSRGVSAFPETC